MCWAPLLCSQNASIVLILDCLGIKSAIKWVSPLAADIFGQSASVVLILDRNNHTDMSVWLARNYRTRHVPMPCCVKV